MREPRIGVSGEAGGGCQSCKSPFAAFEIVIGDYVEVRLCRLCEAELSTQLAITRRQQIELIARPVGEAEGGGDGV